jgi:hypothetical protein
MSDETGQPMCGPPTEQIDKLKSGIQEAVEDLRATVRGDDKWRHPDLYTEEINEVAPMPVEYQAAHDFLLMIFGPDGYTPDAVGQLVDVFLPCLRIMCDREGHPWGPEGELWRAAGILNLTGDVYKKHERFQYRLWTRGAMHEDSGFDLINFVGFCLRSDPDSRFGARGEPAPAPGSREE